MKCPECGVLLDEIPFDKCHTHMSYFNSIPDLTPEELQEIDDYEVAKILYERTGDD